MIDPHHRTALGAFVAERGQPRRLRAGDLLFLEGDQSTSVYACTSGQINLLITAPGGRELIVGTKRPVDGFGELSAVSGSPRTATARAMTPTVVHSMPANTFLDAVKTEPTLALAMLRELALHLGNANRRLSARSVDSVEQRVAQLLVHLSITLGRHNTTRDTKGHTAIGVTQHEVAGWVGSTREAAARALSNLRRLNCITTSRGMITITNADRLESVASGLGRT